MDTIQNHMSRNMTKTVFKMTSLLISNTTGFQLSYLYSCVLQVLFSNATMDSLSHIYNEMHDTDEATEATDDTDPTKTDEQIDDNENEVEGDVKEDERGDEGQGDGEEEADDSPLNNYY